MKSIICSIECGLIIAVAFLIFVTILIILEAFIGTAIDEYKAKRARKRHREETRRRS